MAVDPVVIPAREHCYMQIVEGGRAIHVLLGSDMLREALKWTTGAAPEWVFGDDGKPVSVKIRPAKEGEQGLQMQSCPAGYYYRIPCPNGMAAGWRSEPPDKEE